MHPLKIREQRDLLDAVKQLAKTVPLWYNSAIEKPKFKQQNKARMRQQVCRSVANCSKNAILTRSIWWQSLTAGPSFSSKCSCIVGSDNIISDWPSISYNHPITANVSNDRQGRETPTNDNHREYITSLFHVIKQR